MYFINIAYRAKVMPVELNAKKQPLVDRNLPVFIRNRFF